MEASIALSACEIAENRISSDKIRADLQLACNATQLPPLHIPAKGAGRQVRCRKSPRAALNLGTSEKSRRTSCSAGFGEKSEEGGGAAIVRKQRGENK